MPPFLCAVQRVGRSAGCADRRHRRAPDYSRCPLRPSLSSRRWRVEDVVAEASGFVTY